MEREESFVKLFGCFVFRYSFASGEGDKSTRPLAVTWGTSGGGKSRFIDAVASLDKDLYKKMFDNYKSQKNGILDDFENALLNETMPIAITFNHHSMWTSSEDIKNAAGLRILWRYLCISLTFFDLTRMVTTASFAKTAGVNFISITGM